MARDSGFRHGDIWNKNIYLVGKQFYLIDFGRSSNIMYPPIESKANIRFATRVRTMKQVKQYFFNKMPVNKSAEVYSFHNGRLIELDMINILNMFLTILYLKYD